MRALRVVGLLGCFAAIASQANAISIGWFQVESESVSGSQEEGRVLHISEAKFSEVSSKAKVGDTVELEGEEFEAVVVVPRQVLTLIDKATRTSVRVLVKASATTKK